MSKVEVIVVEDETSSMAAITQALENVGLTYLAISESANAMEAAIKHNPDLAILDYHMSEIDGITLCNELNLDPRTKNIDIIFLSADDNIEDHLVGAKVKYVSAHNKSRPILEVINAVLARNFQKQVDESIKSFQAAHYKIIQICAH